MPWGVMRPQEGAGRFFSRSRIWRLREGPNFLPVPGDSAFPDGTSRCPPTVKSIPRACRGYHGARKIKTPEVGEGPRSARGAGGGRSSFRIVEGEGGARVFDSYLLMIVAGGRGWGLRGQFS